LVFAFGEGENMKKVINFIKKFQTIIIVLIIAICVAIPAIILDWIIFLINKIPNLSIPGLASISDKILFATFLALVWYAWETKRMREIEQEPVMLLYIRDIRDYVSKPEKQQKIRDGGYLIRIRTEGKDSNYFIRLRNTGRGTAFNVTVESSSLKVDKYETQFFAPLTDEHSIKIIEKGNKKIESWKKLNGSVFAIKCRSVNGKFYSFKFKIIDAQKQIVAFLK